MLYPNVGRKLNLLIHLLGLRRLRVHMRVT